MLLDYNLGVPIDLIAETPTSSTLTPESPRSLSEDGMGILNRFEQMPPPKSFNKNAGYIPIPTLAVVVVVVFVLAIIFCILLCILQYYY